MGGYRRSRRFRVLLRFTRNNTRQIYVVCREYLMSTDDDASVCARFKNRFVEEVENK